MRARLLGVWTVCALMGTWVTLGADHPAGLNRNHPYGVLSSAYRTPHVAWAKPYHGGVTKALVLAPYWSQRETVELAQRLAMDFTAWMPTAFSEAAGSASDPAFAFFLPPPALVHRLLRECVAREYDVIVVGKLVWSVLPPKERFELLRKVSEGTGLVYVAPPADDRELEVVLEGGEEAGGRAFITRNLPLGALPAFSDVSPRELVRTGVFGSGRFVVLDYPETAFPEKVTEQPGRPCLTPNWDTTDYREDGFVPLADLPEMEFVPYEYYQALVAKAVLWAGRKEPGVQMRISLADTVAWPASAAAAAVQFDAPPDGAVVKATVRHRYEYDEVLELGTKPASADTVIPLPALPGGEYFLDAWLLDRPDGAVVTWGSVRFAVEADVGFKAVTLARAAHDPGQAVVGEVTLSRPPRQNEAITVELGDSLGRLIAVSRPQPDGASARFRFDPFPPQTILHRVRAVLRRNGDDVAVARLDFPIRAQLRRDDFNSVVWSGTENTFLTHVMLRKLSCEDEADSIDIGWRGSANARNVAAANLSHTPYTARYGVLGGGENNVVPVLADNAYGCMSDPITLGNLQKWGDLQSRIYGPYGPFVWTHGDETNYGHHAPDICWSETCLAAWHRFLRQRYADVGELNREWGTGYAGVDQARPLTFKEAKQTGAYARWVTHRLSADRVFAEFYRQSGEALARHDPGGRGAGFDGGVGLRMPNSGGDWWVLSRSLDLLHAYMFDSGQMELFRSFAQPGQVTGMWFGTYGLTWAVGPNTVPYCHFFPWYSLFHGLNSTWFWTMGAPGPVCGYAPDMTSLPFFAARTRSLKKIKSGIGKLLLHSRRSNDGIALYFSEASRVAESFYAAKETDWSLAYPAALVSFNKALEDCGLQYEYLSYDEVARGDLSTRSFRLLIMPRTRALSPREAEEVRRFVRDGGVVFADIVPGTLNGNGTPQPTSLLADLFPANTAGGVTLFGSGKAVLLGEDLLRGYGKAHMDRFGWARLERRWKQLGDLVAQHARVHPAVTVVSAGDEPMPPTEITRFACGTTEFVGLLREYFLYDNAPYRARVSFPDTTHLYDVLAGEYLGRTGEVTAEMSYRVRLYWRSGYRVDAVELTAPTTAAPGSTTRLDMRVRTAGGGPPSVHCFRLEVLSPGGDPLPHYARNVLAEKGVAQAVIAWALNDRAGQYVVSVTDVNSGTQTRAGVTLR